MHGAFSSGLREVRPLWALGVRGVGPELGSDRQAGEATIKQYPATMHGAFTYNL